MTIDRRTVLKEVSAANLRSELIARLREEITRHEQEIASLNTQIRRLQPTETVVIRRVSNTRTIARNERSLRQVIAQALKDADGSMSVSEILDAVKASGYRSTAVNFRSVISVTLSNTQLFEKQSRGNYILRPGIVLDEDGNLEEASESDTEVRVGSTNASDS